MTSSQAPHRKIHYAQLKAVDLELAYLAALTVEGLKPMSRWERDLDAAKLEPMRSLGLVCRQVLRTVAAGPNVRETIFSNSASLLDLYEGLFAEKPVDKSPVTLQWEGFLFGFPPCCVTHYMGRPYAPNELPPEDQELLFHWACPGCALTPSLVPAYRRILDSIQSC